MGNNEREAEHVQQHLERGFDAVWIVCQDTAVRDGLEERLAEHDLLDERVTVRTVSEVCDEENALTV